MHSGTWEACLVALFAISIPSALGESTKIRYDWHLQEIVDPSYFSYFNFSLVPYKGERTFNGSLRMAKQMDSATLEMSVVIPKPRGRDIRLVNVTLDACRMLSSKNNGNFIASLLKEARKGKSRIPDKCPLLVGEEIILDKILIDMGMDGNMMEFRYKSQINFLTGGKYICKHHFKGTVGKKQYR